MANEKIVVGYGAYMLKLAVATSNYGNARLRKLILVLGGVRYYIT